MQNSTGNSSAAVLGRRHDLDALRAFAMLLGIALHGALSFLPIPWPVRDGQQQELFGWLVSAVHGFRMPVFFVMSGFFTAMLWRRRGLRSLLGHRFRRVRAEVARLVVHHPKQPPQDIPCRFGIRPGVHRSYFSECLDCPPSDEVVRFWQQIY